MGSIKKEDTEKGYNHNFFIILILALILPIIVMPDRLEDAFNTPKTLFLLLGVSLMIGIHAFYLLNGKAVIKTQTDTAKILFFLILLNFFSLLYTKNPFFTRVAATLNVSCLLLIVCIFLYIGEKRAYILIITCALSGLIISVMVWLQFFGIYLIMNKIDPGHIMGTIGNSNYLGAYLIFPLFSMAGLLFIFKGKHRLIPAILFLFIMGAFLFARARSSWIGFSLAFPCFLYLMKKIRGISISAYFRSHYRGMTVCGILIILLIGILWFAGPKRFHEIMDFGKVFESETLRLRVQKYWPPSIWLIKQSPVFGDGLWSYRNQVYRAQAEINRIDPEFFTNYDAPKPRRAHNEYLEILNDGGLVAAGVLLLLFIIIMSHGWDVINNREIGSRYRIITSAGFCSIIAIMFTAIFFFPFRVNSTMFMTVLMMGLIEGAYLRSHHLIFIGKGCSSKTCSILFPFFLILLVGINWNMGLKPLKGEMEQYKYRVSLSRGDQKDAEKHILKAIEYSPLNTDYLFAASQLYMDILKDYGKAGDFVEKSITDFNGDITLWAIYFTKGLVKFKTGSLLEARTAFEKSIYYNPAFEPATQKLEEVNNVIEKHDRIMIKLR